MGLPVLHAAGCAKGSSLSAETGSLAHTLPQAPLLQAPSSLPGRKARKFPEPFPHHTQDHITSGDSQSNLDSVGLSIP